MSGQRIGATTIRVVHQQWIDAPVDALVLSANNHLWLRNATGNAAALHQRCPDLHDEIQALVPPGGFGPGGGLVTRGLAFSPMALRGHASGLVPNGIAPVWLPAVQAGVIASFLATGRAPELERVDFCVDKGIPPALQSSIAATFFDTVEVLARASR